MAYSEKILDHFFNPKNIGSISNADGIGVIGSASCGDAVRVWIRVVAGRLEEIKYRVFGCPAVIACCSVMTEIAAGASIQDAMKLTDDQVVSQLGGLSEQKQHCSNLAVLALHEAIQSYLQKEKADQMAVNITVLVDNTASGDLGCEHGLAFWIEYGDRRILFDTGQSDLVVKNAERMGIDLSRADAIVLSHGHYDHTGGLVSVLDLAPEATVYLHPDAARMRYRCAAGRPAKDISMPKSVCLRLAEQVAVGKVVYTDKPETVIPGILVTGFVPRQTEYEQMKACFYCDDQGKEPDHLPDDQSLLIATSRGAVLLLGCAHAGVINTLMCAETLSGPPIHALIGGMHLRSASEVQIDRTLDVIEERDIAILGPMHCTGQKVSEKMQRRFPESYQKVTAGETIVISPAD